MLPKRDRRAHNPTLSFAAGKNGISCGDQGQRATTVDGSVLIATGSTRLKIGETLIDDTFAEAFGMRYTRMIVTAEDEFWLDAALRELTGYGSSVISCDAEVGREHAVAPDATPDGRVGAAVLLFGFAAESLGKSVANRTGQCVMTCPSTAAYDGLVDGQERIPLGKHIRFFGDGYQKSKLLDGRRFWRIPVMDGEFVVEESLGVEKGVAGGNIILQAASRPLGLAAARRVSEALAEVPGVITPFPGGVVRSGSKVGSRYKGLPASTSHGFCPTLRGRVTSNLIDGAHCAYEIVIDGTSEAAIAEAIVISIRAAAGEGVAAISAGNYGGKLGKFHFRLRDLLSSD